MSVEHVRRNASSITRPAAARVDAPKLKPAIEPKRHVDLKGHAARNTFEPHKKALVDLHGHGRANKPDANQGVAASGTNDDSIGTNDDSIGTNDDSIGGVGQLSPDEARHRRAGIDATETPGYLGAKGKNHFKPEAQAKLDKGIKGAHLGQVDQSQLIAKARRDRDFAGELTSVLHATHSMPTMRTELLHKIAADPTHDAAQVIAHVVQSDAWKKGDDATRKAMATVMAHTGPTGLLSFGKIVETHPGLLAQKSTTGSTLLDALKGMATGKLAPGMADVEHARQRMLSDTLQSIADPNAIDQGFRAPTCTVTSMEFELARDRPAEFARLMNGLTTGNGKVKMAGGGELSLQRGYIAPTSGDGRSMSDAVFQSAAMEYANGKATFDAIHGVSRGPDGERYRGLFPHQQVQMLEQLFGTKYQAVNPDTPAARDQMVDELRHYDPHKARRAVVMDIDLGDHNHAVTFDGIKGNRVYFRDPYGRRSSMSIDQFKADVCTVHVPDSVAQREKNNQVLAAFNPFMHYFDPVSGGVMAPPL